MIDIKWGIMGCAGIARKNIHSLLLSSMESKNKLVAIASRNLEKAKTFLQENNLSSSVIAYGSYEELINDISINAVYIPLPTTLHLEWVSRAAKSGKHILIEKPVSLDLETLKQMYAICHENNVFLMDGVMFMHHKRLSTLRNILKDPYSGRVMRINSSFSFHAGEDFLKSNIRCQASGDPLGAVGDLGWYIVRLGLIAFCNGHDLEIFSSDNPSIDTRSCLPLKCSVKCNQWSSDGIPIDCEGIVWFGYSSLESSQFQYLRFDCSFVLPFRQSFEISLSSAVQGVGDKIIRCNDFVLPRSDHSCELQIESIPSFGPLIDNAVKVTSVIDNIVINECCQEKEMFNNFAEYLHQGQLKSHLPKPEYWEKITLWTQATVDAIIKSVNSDGSVVYVVV